MADNAIDHGASSAHDAAQRDPEASSIQPDAARRQESPSSTQQQAPLGANSSNNSQSATDGLDTISTPQTSSDDGPSSQATSQDATAAAAPQIARSPATRDLLGDDSTSRIGTTTVPPTAGQKRMADGQVKPPSPPSPAGPRYRGGHSRNTSAVSVSSASSRIGELSSELRTRLSYAMVKVNNGWQSNTIEEVESLASLTGSPASSTSTLHGRRNLAASPRANMIAMQGQPSNLPSQSPVVGGDFDLFSRTEAASRTYESFWRDHPTSGSSSSQRPAHATSPPQPHHQPKASLAPPADIRPGTGTGAGSGSRRSQTPKFSKPPSMPTHRSDPTPRTPTQQRPSDRRGVQTPSQKTIQEQDAIETLLFMSSPGNSNSMARGAAFGAPAPRTNPLLGSPQRSPLRAEFRAQQPLDRPGARRVDFGKFAGPVGDGAGVRRAPPPPPSSSGLDESRADVIDRLLDRMSDVSRSSSASSASSHDGDLEVPLSYEPRVAGRV